MTGMDSYGQDCYRAGLRGGLSGYHRPEHAAVREADRKSYDVSDEFPASYYRRRAQRV